jgi:hypothetical protein
VADIAKILAGQDDGPALLAEVAGLGLGYHQGGLGEPMARAAAHFCVEAGADEDFIPRWTEVGRRRAADAALPPFSTPGHGKPPVRARSAHGYRGRMPGPARHLQAVRSARFLVRITVPRRGGVVQWLRASADFERRLAEQQDPPVAGAAIESESRRGRDFVAVRILLTIDAADVAQALTVAWGAFQGAASDDLAGWDLASARAEVQPEQ